MNEQKAFLVINAIVNKANMEVLQSYLGQVMQVFAKTGGKPVARYKTLEQIAGEESPEMVAIVEFSDAETIKTMLNGDDFKNLAGLREKAFTKLNIMICAAM